MLKPKLYLLFVLTFFTGQTFAQDTERFYQELSSESSHTTIYDSNAVEMYVQRDSLIINDIKNPTELELFIKKGGQNKLYAVEINNYLRPDLPAIFKLLSQCPNLQYLKIIDRYGSGNTAEYKLPIEITQLQQLKGIEFSFIDKLDMADALTKVSALKNLQTLVFTDYRWELPPVLSSITQVTTVRLSTINVKGLDLSKTNWRTAYVREVPREPTDNERSLLAMSKIKSLRKLDLEYTKLRDTAVIGKFTQLSDLQIEGWNFQATALVNKIGSLVQLKRLSLLLPLDSTFSFEGLKLLKNLTDLTINTPFKNRQRLFKAMELITGFKNLEALSLVSCNFTMLPDVFDKLPVLKRLSLKYNSLTALPASIFKLPLLEYLNVANNELTQLPPVNCFTCNNLKTLNMRQNGITELPNAITRLTQLEYIYADGNELTSVPEGWQNLKKLKYVGLSENELTAYPPGLQDNHSVEIVKLGINHISYIPDVTGTGYHLKKLYLDANPLMALPEHIGKYTELEMLFVSRAKLTLMPPTLSDCKKLRHLLIDVNVVCPTSLPAGLKIFRNEYIAK
jgi:Leucine-rich repeat (LRR) protein